MPWLRKLVLSWPDPELRRGQGKSDPDREATRQGVCGFIAPSRARRCRRAGLLLRMAFPVDAVGWQWHNGMERAVSIRSAGVYENVVPLRAWADLLE